MPESNIELAGNKNIKTSKVEKSVDTPADFTSPEELYNDLIEKVKMYHPSSDLSDIERAYKVAKKAHEGQFDQSGVPYIFHPIHLAEQMEDETTTCIALLHDVLEDTPLTVQDLEKDFSEEIVQTVLLLTHAPSDDYLDYVRRLCQSPLARKVKLADIAHNTDETRLSGTTPAPEQLKHWRTKYAAAKEIIREYENIP